MIAVALIVVAVWGAVFFRHAGLLGGCLGVLLLGSCFGHAYYHVNLGPLPLTAERVLLGGLLVGYLLLRARRQVDRKQLNHVDLLLIAFMLVLLVSTLTHDWRANNFQALASLVFFYVVPSMLYWVARESWLSQRGLLGCLAFLAGFGIYLAVTSVFEQQQVESLVFPRYVASEAHVEFLGRGRGPFLNPVGNGVFLCAGLFSLLMFWPRVSRYARVLLLLIALVYLAGIFCTLTRVVWLAAGIGLMGLVVLNLPRRWGVVAVLAAGILAAGVVALKWDDLKAFKRDRHVSVAEMSRSASLRPILAYLAWRIYLDHPLLGCGYRQYETVVGHYVSDRSTTLQLERGRNFAQHNVFLALLAETGLVGMSLFLLLLTTLAQTAWRLWRASGTGLATRQMGLFMLLMLGTYVTMGMFQDLALIPMAHMLLFFLAGLTRNLQEHGVRGIVPAGAGERPKTCEQPLHETSCTPSGLPGTVPQPLLR
ncbi:MAG: O-antigen ligase family protein [Planctomycetota bacterium]